MLLDSLRRGVGAGAVAGVAYGALLALALNPLVRHAEHAGHDHGHAHAAEPAVSAATTAVASVGGGVLWGLLLGAGFGVAYYLLEPALPGGDAATASVLAAAGFLTISGIPWLALPPVAPGAEHALDAGTRLAVYAGAMAIGATACALSLLAYRRARADRSRIVAATAAAAPFAPIALASLAVPTGTAGPPAALATAFRWLVVFGQVGLWALLAGTFTALRRRADPDAGATLDEFEDNRSTAGA
ncbi:CbtA family protein [Natronoarchaeum mannanilyticum]|uniref:Cobalt transporter subunit (CbtA) n=1 Tax=Natronoarchaeum mannanilyticum TaxID=926360 RepID=A0AAV3T6K1_9EURY